jgi:putative flavoprotein involved in K+ transport
MSHMLSDVPGLYFLGLPWLSKMSSSFLAGVTDDAARLARRQKGYGLWDYR